jgi:hypothetical protein
MEANEADLGGDCPRPVAIADGHGLAGTYVKEGAMDDDQRAIWLDSMESNTRIRVRRLTRADRALNDLVAGDRAVSTILAGLHLMAKTTPDAELMALATMGGLFDEPTPGYVRKLCRLLSRDPNVWRAIGEAERSGIGDNELY